MGTAPNNSTNYVMASRTPWQSASPKTIKSLAATLPWAGRIISVLIKLISRLTSREKPSSFRSLIMLNIPLWNHWRIRLFVVSMGMGPPLGVDMIWWLEIRPTSCLILPAISRGTLNIPIRISSINEISQGPAGSVSRCRSGRSFRSSSCIPSKPSKTSTLQAPPRIQMKVKRRVSSNESRWQQKISSQAWCQIDSQIDVMIL